MTTPPEIDPSWIPLEFVVCREHAGWRADIFIAHQIPRLSRTRVKRILSQSAFDGQGKRIKPNRTVLEGDRIKVYRPPPVEPEVPRSFGVLYEDEDILAIDKPAGLPVHPTARYHRNTLTFLLRERYGDSPPILAHRLDSETSGVLLLAKNKPAERRLKVMFFKREVNKKYLAVVRGSPENEEGRIEAALGRDLESPIRVKMAVVPDGMPALTEYRVIRALGDASLVECVPRTGRQHQIRVHMAHIGHPIIGDKMYSEDPWLFLEYIEQGPTPEILERAGARRQLLHAASISFIHPISGAEVAIDSPLPDDMAAYIESRRGS